MNKRVESPGVVGRSLCVLEVTRDREQPPRWLQVVVSVPGRPSSFSRTWPNEDHAIKAEQVRDLLAWVEKRIVDALAVSMGIQERLEDGQ